LTSGDNSWDCDAIPTYDHSSTWNNRMHFVYFKKDDFTRSMNLLLSWTKAATKGYIIPNIKNDNGVYSPQKLTGSSVWNASLGGVWDAGTGTDPMSTGIHQLAFYSTTTAYVAQARPCQIKGRIFRVRRWKKYTIYKYK
jgi:hypothetical protein